MGKLIFRKIARNQSGFTLVEILVAMAIFALIAVGSVTMLSAVTTQNELSDERMKALQDMQRAMLIIERDFLQMVPRKTRVDGDVSDILVFAEKFAFESDSGSIGFVRSGWHNPQLTLRRSTMQSVAYRTQEWKQAESVEELPIAVAIIIESEAYGEIRREFKVRR